MSLADLIRKSEPARVATAIAAIGATDGDDKRGNVAGIATVAVAKRTVKESEPAEAMRPSAAPESDCQPSGSGEALRDGPHSAQAAHRMRHFIGHGMSEGDAERWVERLALRDEECDDRRICLECSYLGSGGRCIAAATGRLPGASPRLEPVPTILQRCEGFGLRKGWG